MPSPDVAFDEAAAALAGERGGSTGKRLDFVSRALILRMRAIAPDKPVAEIARELGHHPVTVGKVLAHQEADAKAFTQALMQTAMPDRLDEWDTACSIAALKGDHRPMRDWGIAAGSIEPPAAASTNVNVGFQVVVAPRPGLPDYAVNELPAPVVTRVSAPASHVLADASSSVETHMRTNDQTPTGPDANVLRTDVPTQVAGEVLTTTITQRAPLTTHPPTIPPAHTSMRQRPRSRIRR